MLNTMLVSVWAILVTLGIFYLQQDRPQDTEIAEAPEEVFETYDSGTVSSAIFNGGNAAGHFVTTVRFELPEKIYENLQIPIELIIGDQLFGVLNSTNIKEIKKVENVDLQKIAQKLEEALHSTDLPIKIIMLKDTEILSK